MNLPNKPLRALLVILALAAPAAAAAPGLTWASATEGYFTMPLGSQVRYPDNNKTVDTDAWGFGLRAVGNGEGVSRTAGLQFERHTASNSGLGVNGTFYLFDFLAGAEYVSPVRNGRPLRFTASGLIDLGMSDTTFYLAPVLTAGLLYQKNVYDTAPGGFTLTLYYRFTDIDLDNAAGKAGTLKPALGVRLGYIFEGFWKPAK